MIALAEVEGGVVAHQKPEPLQHRLVEAVLLLELLMNFGSEPCDPRMAPKRCRPRPGRCLDADLAATSGFAVEL